MGKKVIAVVGEKKTGKDAVCKIIQERCSWPLLRYSDVLGEILYSLRLPLSRKNYQGLASALIAWRGDEILVSAVNERISESESDYILLCGLRKLEEYYDFRKTYPEGIVLFIDSSVKNRYERALKDPNGKTGESSITMGQFIEEDHDPNEVEIRDVGDKADYTIENNGTEKDLERKVHQFLDAYSY